MNKIVIGTGILLSHAVQSWKEARPDMEIIPVPMTQDDSYNFDFTVLEAYEPSSTTAFIAWDDGFLNLQRYELYSHLKKLGFALPPLIHPQTLIDSQVEILENTWVDQGVKIGRDVKIGLNTIIGFGVSLHPDSQIGEHVTLEAGAIIGAGSKVHSFVTIGTAVALNSGCNIGSFSRLTKSGNFKGDYPEGTYIEDRFEAIIRT